MAAEAARGNRDRESEEKVREERKSLNQFVVQVAQEEEKEEEASALISQEEKICREHLIHTYHAVLFSK